MNSDLIALDLVKAFEVAKNEVLVRNTRTGAVAAVTSDVFFALTLCKQFRTVQEHAQHLVGEIPALRGHAEQVQRVLQESIANGLLVTAVEARKWFNTRNDSEREPRQSGGPDRAVVVIITWERPAALERLLDSMVGACNLDNVEVIYVVDDSRDEIVIGQNQAIVQGFSEKLTTLVSYFGQEAQQALIQGIIQKLPGSEKSVRFLMDQSKWQAYWSSGLARNVALLLSVGKRLVMLDDDTVFAAYAPDAPKAGMAINNSEREARFFADKAVWRGFSNRASFDPVEGHLECLGSKFEDVVKKYRGQGAGPDIFAGATMDEISRMGNTSPVLISQCGTLGHPGTVSNTWISKLSEDSISRMLESSATVDNAIENSNVWLGRIQFSVSNTANMSQTTGLDNRVSLPPYFPILRSEDLLFGNMVNYLFPESIVVDYPWATPHLPIGSRVRSPEHSDFGIKIGFPMFFYDQIMLQKAHCHATEFPDRLQHLAQSFMDLSNSSSEFLSECYRNKRIHLGCDRLKEIGTRLARDAAAPENWISFLKKGAEKINEEIKSESGNHQISGTPANVFDEELINLWREYWRDYGQALELWPEIREAAAAVSF